MTIYSGFDDIPRRHYGVIYADPAWRFKPYAPPKLGARHRRDVEKHYPTMTLAEIKALPVAEVAGRDCWLMLWATWPMMPHALEVMAAWGFKYSSSFQVWFKMKKGSSPTRQVVIIPNDIHIGSGYTTRKNTEFVLLGRRGSPPRLARNIREPIFEPVREHSRKPDGVRDDIERFANGPYLEMNARTEVPGWDQWGNEVQKFEPPATPIILQTEPDMVQPEMFIDEPEDPDIPAFLRRLAGG